MRRPPLPQLIVGTAALVVMAASGLGYLDRDGRASSAGSAPGTVRIANFSYGPNTVEASVGDTVTWTNDDNFAHTVTSPSGGTLDSGEVRGGGTFQATFDAAGSFEYVCTIHPSMKGVVKVVSG